MGLAIYSSCRCSSVRYDISLSKADWPNLDHQQYVMNRSRGKWGDIEGAETLLQGFFDDSNYVNNTFFKWVSSKSSLKKQFYSQKLSLP